jgi:DNA-binding NarL/FixJ family response regulator
LISETRRKSRVYLVDWRPIARYILRILLTETPDIELVGWTADPDVPVEKILFFRPDLVLTDVFLKNLAGITLTKRLSKAAPKLPVLVISVTDDPAYALMSLEAGARGYMQIMREEPAIIVQAIRQVLEGGKFLSAGLAADVADAVAKNKGEGTFKPSSVLSSRELMVFHLMGRGYSTGEIAETLHLSPKTVLAHRGRIQRKMGFKKSSQLIHRAIQWACQQGTQ